MEYPIPRIDPEFKALIPPLSVEEYKQLEENIISGKKCRDAIVVWNGTIVDGHNRFEICVRHSVSFEIKEMEFDSRDEAMLWILDNQLGRRNLSDAMRIEVALGRAELLKRQARENQKLGGLYKSRAGELLVKIPKANNEPVNVRETVADDAGVCSKTVQNYMQIAKHGTPGLLEHVKTGDLKINTAHRLLNTEILKQLKHADKLYRYDVAIPLGYVEFYTSH